jgi:predicted dehydrogenase
MSDRSRLGIIGCGFFAQNHLNAWRDLRDQGVHITAACDVDPEKAKAAAEEFGVPQWYDSAERMLDCEEFDLVDIITQVRSHKPLVDMTVGRGIATIVQKPFGDNLQECRDMKALADKTGTFLAVHENFRFQHPNRIVSEIIGSGAIGTPNWGRISFRTGYDIYAGQPYLLKEERFVVVDLGAHVLDLARAFFGEVDRLTAELQKRNPKVRGEDTATMMLRHVSGAVSLVECTYESRRLPDVFPATVLEIEGSDGAIRLRGDLTIEVTSNGQMTTRDGDAPVIRWAERPWHIVQESVLRTCEHIFRKFRAGEPADVSAADNFKTYALCEAAYVAAETGKAAKPEE